MLFRQIRFSLQTASFSLAGRLLRAGSVITGRIVVLLHPLVRVFDVRVIFAGNELVLLASRCNRLGRGLTGLDNVYDRLNRYQLVKVVELHGHGLEGVLVVHGGEITSQIMPPGHMNVLFVNDNNPVGAAMDAAGKNRQPEGADAAVRVARKQGAFVTWNHPNWCRQAPDKTVIYPEHEQYRKEGIINGVEIYNWWDGYCKEGHHWAVEHGLTLMSGTDSHHPMFMDIDFLAGELRPATLIFAKERTLGGVREALDNQRTAVFAEGKVYGAAELLTPLLDACIVVKKVTKTKTKLTIEVYNCSSIPVILDKAPGSEQWQISRHLTLHPFEHQTLTLYRLNKSEPLDSDVFDLHYTVDNFFTDADVKLPWVLHIEK